MVSSVIIFGVSIIVLIASILFFSNVIFHGKSIKVYAWIPVVGAVAMLLLRKVSWEKVVSAFTENTSVNPIKILTLFLSMTVFSLILEQTGFFGYISGKVLRHAGKNQFRLFLALYAVISVLTIFTSNDIIILTFTPFIIRFCHSGKR